MSISVGSASQLEIVVSARMVADLAASEGIEIDSCGARACYSHLGAILADSVLQSGLNYSTVVRPRVQRVLAEYAYADSITDLVEIVDRGQVEIFLNWRHPNKIFRFVRLVERLDRAGVGNAVSLRTRLLDDEFCAHLQEIDGIGPKTVDYMACLAGIESVAVDRHIRNYAKRAGIEVTEYYFLKKVFCFAADFLEVSRREFDAWVWRRESGSRPVQLNFDFVV